MKTNLYFLSIIIVAFVAISCGPPLPEEGTTSLKKYSVEEALEILAKENDVTRTLYTKAIVGAGKKQGLKFDENWDKDDVEAGPLPALFLRGIASDITKKGEVPLGLFLGSDFPVRKSNKFSGKQEELFAKMREDKEPAFFFDEASKLQTAMFPDFAVAQPCVTCHNAHPETTKTDWELGDLMGATTWTYPEDSLSFDELEAVILAYRKGAAATYNSFLEEARAFKTEAVPEIGEKWPAQGGLYLPTAEVFLDSVKLLASAETLQGILKQ